MGSRKRGHGLELQAAPWLHCPAAGAVTCGDMLSQSLSSCSIVDRIVEAARVEVLGLVSHRKSLNEPELFVIRAYLTVILSRHRPSVSCLHHCTAGAVLHGIRSESQSMPEAANDIMGSRWGGDHASVTARSDRRDLSRHRSSMYEFGFRGCIGGRRPNIGRKKGVSRPTFSTAPRCSVAES
jgi:hypothetical protein